MDGGTITIGTKLDTKQFDKQIADLERKTKELENQLSAPKELSGLSSEDIKNIEIELEKTTNKLIKLRQEKAKAEQPQGMQQLKKSVDGLGQGLQNAVQKASRLVLGIFGIRSAFMLMRRASSELASYDDEYAANLEYIRFVLTQAIAPVLEYVVNLAMKLLAYINAIAQAWFGVNLFERGSVDNFKKMKQGVGGVTGAVKELKKQLAGFDEINVLQDDGSVGTGGGGGGIALPSMDLANLQDIEIPSWVKWIMDHKTEILGLLTAIGAFFLGAKIASFIRNLTGAEGAVLKFNSQLGKMVAGAALVAGGIALMITGSQNLANNWDKMTGAERAAQVGMVALGGVMTAFGLTMMGVSGPVAAVLAFIGVLASLLIAEDKEKGNIKDLTAAEERLDEAKKKSKEAYNEYINAIDNAEQAEKSLKQAQDSTGISAEELNRQVEQGVLDYKDMTAQQREVYKAYLNNRDAQERLTNATKESAEASKNETIAEWERKLAIDANADAYEEYKRSVIDAYNRQELKADEARQLLEEAMQGMGMASQETFMQDIPDAVKEGMDPERYQSIIDRFTNAFTDGFWNFIRTAKRWFDRFMSYVAESFSLGPIGSFKKGMETIGTIFGSAKGSVVYHGLPRLAVGGIINQPGRGIPIGRAIAGERGAEGVIPLTDSQQMQLLGEAIGRYVTINANIPVSMNGRVISRELKQVQADQQFAYNT